MTERSAKPPRGIPGLAGGEHIGFTVPDIEEATRFFVDIIGCDHVYTLEGMQPANNWMETHLNVHARATIKQIVLLRCKNGPNLEIFEYSSPNQNHVQPLNSDLGGHHIAFYVDDIDQAVHYLRTVGVTVMGEPTSSKGASEGQRWVYFLSPWGMQLELVSYPNGKAYEPGARLKLWHPKHPQY